MSNEAVHGLSCPRCGGMVSIPEGQALVVCPYCDQRSVVTAEQAAAGNLGVRRYQAPCNINRDQAAQAFRSFLSGKVQIARDAARQAQVVEAFLVHLPFWAVWGRGAAYAFGQVQVGSGDNKRYEPREKRVVRDLTWNTPACEVGEFGVQKIKLEGCPLQPFNPEVLHRTGMVFEPVGAEEAALEEARKSFESEIRDEVKMDRTAQVFTRVIRPRMGVLYYPLWVIRYLYRGRSFQVVVDGVDGQVLYGKAPGSVGFRAGVLVGGMASGAVVAIDGPVLALTFLDSHSSKNSDGLGALALLLFVIGIGLLFTAYRTFRYGEHYEYHRYKVKKQDAGSVFNSLPGQVKDMTNLISSLEKYR